MLAILVSLSLCLGTVTILWGGWVGQRHVLTFAGFDLSALLLGILAVAAAVYFFNPMYGAALILSVMVHEFGHVAAYRICGHSDARFRLIPLIGGVAISSQVPASQEKQFFISLMGPGICLAPMCLAMAFVELDWQEYSPLIEFLWIFATVTAALNFFNLLPFWPLDGGRCISILAHSLVPSIAGQVTMAMSAAAILLAVYTQSMGMIFFALMGVQNLIQGGDTASVQRAMSLRRSLLASGAYLTTLAAFGLAGWPLLARFF